MGTFHRPHSIWKSCCLFSHIFLICIRWCRTSFLFQFTSTRFQIPLRFQISPARFREVTPNLRISPPLDFIGGPPLDFKKWVPALWFLLVPLWYLGAPVTPKFHLRYISFTSARFQIASARFRISKSTSARFQIPLRFQISPPRDLGSSTPACAYLSDFFCTKKTPWYLNHVID